MGFFGGVAEGISKGKKKKDDKKKDSSNKVSVDTKTTQKGASKIAEKAGKDMESAYRPKREDSKSRGSSKTRD